MARPRASSPERVECRLAEEAAATAGVPQIAAHFLQFQSRWDRVTRGFRGRWQLTLVIGSRRHDARLTCNCDISRLARWR